MLYQRQYVQKVYPSGCFPCSSYHIEDEFPLSQQIDSSKEVINYLNDLSDSEFEFINEEIKQMIFMSQPFDMIRAQLEEFRE